ncbi:hypothetical protein LEP1GSC052_2986 [Leptospira kmetyi serovar Malaysia str. Bejo-Iso9]|nr:hypothetical protein LEP1GSC052_2986 [Leptospira kmetyi serovar Malaysia str. Bejo-Iso9]
MGFFSDSGFKQGRSYFLEKCRNSNLSNSRHFVLPTFTTMNHFYEPANLFRRLSLLSKSRRSALRKTDVLHETNPDIGIREEISLKNLS